MAYLNDKKILTVLKPSYLNVDDDVVSFMTNEYNKSQDPEIGEIVHINQLNTVESNLATTEGKATTNASNIAKIVDGDTAVGKAIADENGNNIANTYATKNEVATDYATKEENDKSLYHLGAFDSVSGNIITRQTGYKVLDNNVEIVSEWQSTGNGYWVMAIALPNCDKTDLANVVANCNITNNQDAYWSQTFTGFLMCVGASYSESGYIIIAYGGATTHDQLINALAQNPVYIQYKLATSYPEDIIPNQPINTLDQQGSQYVRSEWEKGLNLCDNTDIYFNQYRNLIIGKIPHLESGIYTLSVGSGYSGSNQTIKLYDSSLSEISSNVGTFINGVGTITISSAISNCYLLIAGGTYTSKPQVMLVKGSIAYPYQKYYGSIVHTTEAFEAVGGSKNLCSISNFEGDASGSNQYQAVREFHLSEYANEYGTYFITFNYEQSAVGSIAIDYYVNGSYVGGLATTELNGLFTYGIPFESGRDPYVKIYINYGSPVVRHVKLTDFMLSKGEPLPYKERTGKVVFEKDLEDVNVKVDNLINGTTPAAKAVSDSAGNNIVNTYATKTSVNTELGKKQNVISSTNKLDANLIQESTSKQFISATEKGKISSNEQAISSIKDGQNLDSFKDVESSLSTKADKSTTYTKTEVDGLLGAKQNTISDLATIRQGASKGATAVQDSKYVHTDNNFTAAYKTKLDGIATGAEVNVQSDWNQTNTSADDFIKNKPINVSAFKNDKGYLTQHQDISGKANYVDTVVSKGNKIANSNKLIDNGIYTTSPSTWDSNDPAPDYEYGVLVSFRNTQQQFQLYKPDGTAHLWIRGNWNTSSTSGTAGSWTKIAYIGDIPSLSGYATQSWVNNKGYITGINSSMITNALGYTPSRFSGSYNDLTNKPSIPTRHTQTITTDGAGDVYDTYLTIMNSITAQAYIATTRAGGYPTFFRYGEGSDDENDWYTAYTMYGTSIRAAKSETIDVVWYS